MYKRVHFDLRKSLLLSDWLIDSQDRMCAMGIYLERCYEFNCENGMNKLGLKDVRFFVRVRC